MERSKGNESPPHVLPTQSQVHVVEGTHYARLSDETKGVAISDEIAPRLAFVFSLQGGTDEMQKERLSNMNCHDATAFILGGAESIRDIDDFMRSRSLIDHRRYESVGALTDFLHVIAQRPVMISVDYYHSFVFWGFDEKGQGVVFNKANARRPCELTSLADVYERYRDRGQEPLLNIYYVPGVTVRVRE